MFIFLIITVGILFQSIVISVTSPLPKDHPSYFHAFSIAFIIYIFFGNEDLKKIYTIIGAAFLILLCWSGNYWDYLNRIFQFSAPVKSKEISVPLTRWEENDLFTFQKMYLPQSTNEGLRRLKNIYGEKNHDLKVLNMSELTSLSY
jgi:hypothetical protein